MLSSNVRRAVEKSGKLTRRCGVLGPRSEGCVAKMSEWPLKLRDSSNVRMYVTRERRILREGFDAPPNLVAEQSRVKKVVYDPKREKELIAEDVRAVMRAYVPTSTLRSIGMKQLSGSSLRMWQRKVGDLENDLTKSSLEVATDLKRPILPDLEQVVEFPDWICAFESLIRAAIYFQHEEKNYDLPTTASFSQWNKLIQEAQEKETHRQNLEEPLKLALQDIHPANLQMAARQREIEEANMSNKQSGITWEQMLHSKAHFYSEEEKALAIDGPFQAIFNNKPEELKRLSAYLAAIDVGKESDFLREDEAKRSKIIQQAIQERAQSIKHYSHLVDLAESALVREHLIKSTNAKRAINMESAETLMRRLMAGGIKNNDGTITTNDDDAAVEAFASGKYDEEKDDDDVLDRLHQEAIAIAADADAAEAKDLFEDTKQNYEDETGWIPSSFHSTQPSSSPLSRTSPPSRADIVAQLLTELASSSSVVASASGNKSRSEIKDFRAALPSLFLSSYPTTSPIASQEVFDPSTLSPEDYTTYIQLESCLSKLDLHLSTKRPSASELASNPLLQDMTNLFQLLVSSGIESSKIPTNALKTSLHTLLAEEIKAEGGVVSNSSSSSSTVVAPSFGASDLFELSEEQQSLIASALYLEEEHGFPPGTLIHPLARDVLFGVESEDLLDLDEVELALLGEQSMETLLPQLQEAKSEIVPQVQAQFDQLQKDIALAKLDLLERAVARGKTLDVERQSALEHLRHLSVHYNAQVEDAGDDALLSKVHTSHLLKTHILQEEEEEESVTKKSDPLAVDFGDVNGLKDLLCSKDWLEQEGKLVASERGVVDDDGGEDVFVGLNDGAIQELATALSPQSPNSFRGLFATEDREDGNALLMKAALDEALIDLEVLYAEDAEATALEAAKQREHFVLEKEAKSEELSGEMKPKKDEINDDDDVVVAENEVGLYDEDGEAIVDPDSIDTAVVAAIATPPSTTPPPFFERHQKFNSRPNIPTVRPSPIPGFQKRIRDLIAIERIPIDLKATREFQRLMIHRQSTYRKLMTSHRRDRLVLKQLVEFCNDSFDAYPQWFPRRIRPLSQLLSLHEEDVWASKLGVQTNGDNEQLTQDWKRQTSESVLQLAGVFGVRPEERERVIANMTNPAQIHGSTLPISHESLIGNKQLESSNNSSNDTSSTFASSPILPLGALAKEKLKTIFGNQLHSYLDTIKETDPNNQTSIEAKRRIQFALSEDFSKDKNGENILPASSAFPSAASHPTGQVSLTDIMVNPSLRRVVNALSKKVPNPQNWPRSFLAISGLSSSSSSSSSQSQQVGEISSSTSSFADPSKPFGEGRPLLDEPEHQLSSSSDFGETTSSDASFGRLTAEDKATLHSLIPENAADIESVASVAKQSHSMSNLAKDPRFGTLVMRRSAQTKHAVMDGPFERGISFEVRKSIARTQEYLKQLNEKREESDEMVYVSLTHGEPDRVKPYTMEILKSSADKKKGASKRRRTLEKDASSSSSSSSSVSVSVPSSSLEERIKDDELILDLVHSHFPVGYDSKFTAIQHESSNAAASSSVGDGEDDFEYLDRTTFKHAMEPFKHYEELAKLDEITSSSVDLHTLESSKEWKKIEKDILDSVSLAPSLNPKQQIKHLKRVYKQTRDNHRKERLLDVRIAAIDELMSSQLKTKFEAHMEPRHKELFNKVTNPEVKELSKSEEMELLHLTEVLARKLQSQGVLPAVDPKAYEEMKSLLEDIEFYSKDLIGEAEKADARVADIDAAEKLEQLQMEGDLQDESPIKHLREQFIATVLRGGDPQTRTILLNASQQGLLEEIALGAGRSKRTSERSHIPKDEDELISRMLLSLPTHIMDAAIDQTLQTLRRSAMGLAPLNAIQLEDNSTHMDSLRLRIAAEMEMTKKKQANSSNVSTSSTSLDLLPPIHGLSQEETNFINQKVAEADSQYLNLIETKKLLLKQHGLKPFVHREEDEINADDLDQDIDEFNDDLARSRKYFGQEHQRKKDSEEEELEGSTDSPFSSSSSSPYITKSDVDDELVGGLVRPKNVLEISIHDLRTKGMTTNANRLAKNSHSNFSEDVSHIPLAHEDPMFGIENNEYTERAVNEVLLEEALAGNLSTTAAATTPLPLQSNLSTSSLNRPLSEFDLNYSKIVGGKMGTDAEMEIHPLLTLDMSDPSAVASFMASLPDFLFGKEGIARKALQDAHEASMAEYASIQTGTAALPPSTKAKDQLDDIDLAQKSLADFSSSVDLAHSIGTSNFSQKLAGEISRISKNLEEPSLVAEFQQIADHLSLNTLYKSGLVSPDHWSVKTTPEEMKKAHFDLFDGKKSVAAIASLSQIGSVDAAVEVGKNLLKVLTSPEVREPTKLLATSLLQLISHPAFFGGDAAKAKEVRSILPIPAAEGPTTKALLDALSDPSNEMVQIIHYLVNGGNIAEEAKTPVMRMFEEKVMRGAEQDMQYQKWLEEIVQKGDVSRLGRELSRLGVFESGAHKKQLDDLKAYQEAVMEESRKFGEMVETALIAMRGEGRGMKHVVLGERIAVHEAHLKTDYDLLQRTEALSAHPEKAGTSGDGKIMWTKAISTAKNGSTLRYFIDPESGLEYEINLDMKEQYDRATKSSAQVLDDSVGMGGIEGMVQQMTREEMTSLLESSGAQLDSAEYGRTTQDVIDQGKYEDYWMKMMRDMQPIDLYPLPRPEPLPGHSLDDTPTMKEYMQRWATLHMDGQLPPSTPAERSAVWRSGADSGKSLMNAYNAMLEQKVDPLPALGNDWELTDPNDPALHHWTHFSKYDEGALVLQIDPSSFTHDGIHFEVERVAIILPDVGRLFLSERVINKVDVSREHDDEHADEIIAQQTLSPQAKLNALLEDYDNVHGDPNSFLSITDPEVLDVLQKHSRGELSSVADSELDDNLELTKPSYPYIRQRVFDIPHNLLISLKRVKWPSSQDLEAQQLKGFIASSSNPGMDDVPGETIPHTDPNQHIQFLNNWIQDAKDKLHKTMTQDRESL
jgi:hypothetical protein